MFETEYIKYIALINILKGINLEDINVYYIFIFFTLYILHINQKKIHKVIFSFYNSFTKEAYIITGSKTISNKYTIKINEYIGTVALKHYIKQNFNKITKIYSLEEISTNTSLDTYNTKDKNKIISNFNIGENNEICLPNGLKVITWKEQSQNSENNNTNAHIEEYKIKISYDKFIAREHNLQYILKNLETMITDYDTYKKKHKDLNQYLISFSDRDESDNTVFFNFLKINEIYKTKDHVFFEGKDAFYKKINYFINNKQEYIKRGKAYRYIILAYGKPGTGKTSVLYSLVNEVRNTRNEKLHLINIDLQKLTRLELFELFHKEKIYLNDYKESCIYIPLDQRIYFIEEIDLIPKLHNRKENKEKETDKNLLESLIKKLDEDDDDELLNKNKKKIITNTDTCTLKDILELLDGFPPINGPIIYMTANNIGALDPALIRPGRVNLIQEFKNITKDNAIKYIEKYYNTKITDTSKINITDYSMSPAELEIRCDNNDITDLLNSFVK